MIRSLLLLGCVVGAAAVGATEASAVAVVDVARVLAQTAPDSPLAPVGFKRH